MSRASAGRLGHCGGRAAWWAGAEQEGQTRRRAGLGKAGAKNGQTRPKQARTYTSKTWLGSDPVRLIQKEEENKPVTWDDNQQQCAPRTAGQEGTRRQLHANRLSGSGSGDTHSHMGLRRSRGLKEPHINQRHRIHNKKHPPKRSPTLRRFPS